LLFSCSGLRYVLVPTWVVSKDYCENDRTIIDMAFGFILLKALGEIFALPPNVSLYKLGWLVNFLANPKSPIFRMFPSMNMLAGFKSLWIKPFWWMCLTALNSCLKKLMFSNLSATLSGSSKYSYNDFPEQYSIYIIKSMEINFWSFLINSIKASSSNLSMFESSSN
jgi:hypothetical protein